jgi:ankyrin repeat protein
LDKNEKFIPIIELLIAYKIDVNSKDRDGDNALHYLCVNYDNENLIDIIRLLIKNGIDVNSKDRDGWNYLHLLCEHYNKKNLIDIIRLLIENKIDVNCKNRDRQNAITIMQQPHRENCNEIVKLLSNSHTTDVAEEKTRQMKRRNLKSNLNRRFKKKS